MSRGARSAVVRLCTSGLANSDFAAIERLAASTPGIAVLARCTSPIETQQVIARDDPNLLLVPLSEQGLQVVAALMAHSPLPIVALAGNLPGPGLRSQAIAAGALEVLQIPKRSFDQGMNLAEEEFLARLRRLAGAAVIRHPRGKLGRRMRLAAAVRRAIVAICASTGGPQALATLLGKLPADFPVPIVLVQHLPRTFGESFASWLDGWCELDVKVAEEGEGPLAGTIYVAPGEAQLTLDREGSFCLREFSSGQRSNESGDRLLRSVARRYGRRAVGVILTGMGSDGVEGLAEIKQSGGLTIAQDESSSAIWGMPGVAVQREAAEFVLPLDEIAATLVRATEVSGWRSTPVIR